MSVFSETMSSVSLTMIMLFDLLFPLPSILYSSICESTESYLLLLLKSSGLETEVLKRLGPKLPAEASFLYK